MANLTEIVTKEELEMQGIFSLNIIAYGYEIWGRNDERFLLDALKDGKYEIHLSYNLKTTNSQS